MFVCWLNGVLDQPGFSPTGLFTMGILIMGLLTVSRVDATGFVSLGGDRRNTVLLLHG